MLKTAMSAHKMAFASAVSFGDFVIPHSVLNRVEANAKANIRMIACSHLKDLNAVLPDGVRVTVLETGENRVPALFDVKKCGLRAAIQSGLSLRRRLQKVERARDELLVFHSLGVRERFISGRWPVVEPRARDNIYASYMRFLVDEAVPIAPAQPVPIGNPRTVGIFPESRLLEKRLSVRALSTIMTRAKRSGIETKIFVLDGDQISHYEDANIVNIPRSFDSLAAAIKSVDCVISADSLPAHLGEYFERPVFVALARPNDYWLPHGCFTEKRWGLFNNESEFAVSLDRFVGGG